MTMANIDPHLPADPPRMARGRSSEAAPPPRPVEANDPALLDEIAEPVLAFRSLPPMRYPNLYTWFVLVSSLDIMLTWLVLEQEGGSEVNPIAAAVIDHWGLPGAIGFKFSLMLFVIIICEIIGRQRDLTAKRLAQWSVGVSAFPPLYTMVLVFLHVMDSPLLDLAGL